MLNSYLSCLVYLVKHEAHCLLFQLCDVAEVAIQKCTFGTFIFFWKGCEHLPPCPKNIYNFLKKKTTSYDQQFICIEDSEDMKKLNLMHSHN
jgi:hypothetical protein